MVQLIFQLCIEGNGPRKISRILQEREIPSPATLEFQRTGHTKRYHPDTPYYWPSGTIACKLFLLGEWDLLSGLIVVVAVHLSLKHQPLFIQRGKIQSPD